MRSFDIIDIAITADIYRYLQTFADAFDDICKNNYRIFADF